MAKANSNVLDLNVKADTTESLIKEINGWGNMVLKLTTDDVHALAMRALAHAFGDGKANPGCGDLTPLLRLQNVMPKSMRKLEFAKWAQAYAPIDWGKVDPATTSCADIKKAKEGTKHFKVFDYAATDNTRFYEAGEVVKPKGIIDAVKQLMTQRANYVKMLADPSITRKPGVTDEAIEQEIAIIDVMTKAVAAKMKAA